MKNYISLSVAMLILCSLIACSKVQVTNQTPAEVESDYYTVSLGWEGDIIEVTEEPLTRADNNNDVYGIQVYSTPNKEDNTGTSVKWEPYGYGLFDDGKNITINLLKGFRYKFVVTMVVDAKNKLNTSIQSGNLAFLTPFSAGGWTSLTNMFDYQSSIFLSSLHSGNSYLDVPHAQYSLPNTERFYGEYLDYIPGLKNNERVMIKMKRASFGAKFIAKGKLAKEGKLEIQITDAPKIMLDLTTSDKSYSDIYTFKNVKAAAEENTYTETHDVTINWHKDDGTIFPLGTHEIMYKRNKTTTVNVVIETEHAANGIGVEIDDVDMSEDDEDITIQDGELVETEIDTNA